MSEEILRLAGDGIGPEVIDAASRVIEAAAEAEGFSVRFVDGLIGGAAIDAGEPPLPPSVAARARDSQAILLGAVGGPRWESHRPRPESGLLTLRQELGLFANLRPVRVFPGLEAVSPLKAPRVDLVIVRELTGGLYYGQPRGINDADGPDPEAFETLRYRRSEIVRIVRAAFELARARGQALTSVDKANVLESSRLWRRTVDEIAGEFPDVRVHHQLVDSAAALLVTDPGRFGVMVTENLFGDILSDLAGGLAGSLGLCPSASLGNGRQGLYEPVHGSAPDIAGRDVANPLGAILSGAMLLRHSFGRTEAADRIERAVEQALAEGWRTADLYTGRPGERRVGCRALADRICALVA